MPEEPWISQFNPAVLTEHLKEMGFARVSNFGPKEAYALHLGGHTDELSPSLF
ncbi:MAG: hypothetical protein JXA01_02930 [Dehalococcoidia bacterium]|nr:hypothetical protein [Dehalococcoidia bacterium]